MKFLALDAARAYALLGATALAILGLYLLRPPPRRVRVASTMLWERLLRSQKPKREAWRWWVSLLLALCAGLAIALAIPQPELRSAGDLATRLIVVVDNSGSMAATGADGRSRFDHALAHARALIQSAPRGGMVLLLDTQGQAGTYEFTAPEQALAELSKLRVAQRSARFPPLPRADALDGKVSVHFISDGVAAIQPPAQARITSVFAPADNVAITAFEAKPVPADPTRYQAFVQVYNASVRDKSAQLLITGADGFRLTRTLNISAGSALSEVLDVSDFPAGVLRAAVLAENDGYDVDDNAYAYVQRHARRKVLLVTRGSEFLPSALRLQHGVELSIVTPERYDANSAVDAVIFDRYAPPARPRAPALLFSPSTTDWLPPRIAEVKHPAVTRWDASHPLLQALSQHDVSLERAALLQVGTAANSIVQARGSAEGTLIALSESGPRWIAVSFALEESNLHLQAGFPVFLGNALDWLVQRPAVLEREVGWVELPLPNAKVVSAENRELATVSTGAGTGFEMDRPGYIRATSQGYTMQLVVNVLDPRVAAVNQSRFAAQGSAKLPAPATQQRQPAREFWVWLLLLALGVLTLEWWTYHRRITV